MDWVDDLFNYLDDVKASAYKNYMFTDIDGKERPIVMLNELHKGDRISVNGYSVDILDDQKIEFNRNSGACNRLIGYDSSDGEELKFDIREIEVYFVRSDLSLYDVSFKHGEFYHSNFYIAENEEQIKSYFENYKDDSELVGYKKVDFYALKHNERGKPVVNISYETVSNKAEDIIQETDADRYPDLITSAIEYLEDLSKGVSSDYVNNLADSTEKFLLTTGVISPIISDLKKLKDEYQKRFCESLSIDEKKKDTKLAEDSKKGKKKNKKNIR